MADEFIEEEERQRSLMHILLLIKRIEDELQKLLRA